MQLTGTHLDFLIAFAGGVLVSFTPCVYPVMPLTASLLAGMNTNGSRVSGLVLSMIYVLGMAVVYCTLAIGASYSGRVFGQYQNHPVVFSVVALVLLFFALMMFDVVSLPGIGFAAGHRVRMTNVWTVFLFGMASALIIGPCTAPVLGTLLLYIGSKENVLHSTALMFLFAYGMGASLILVGTFSDLLSRMPKSGVWMVRVKQFCGVVLFVAGIYYLVKAGGLL